MKGLVVVLNPVASSLYPPHESWSVLGIKVRLEIIIEITVQLSDINLLSALVPAVLAVKAIVSQVKESAMLKLHEIVSAVAALLSAPCGWCVSTAQWLVIFESRVPPKKTELGVRLLPLTFKPLCPPWEGEALRI